MENNNNNERLAEIGRLYDAGASLQGIIEATGTDEESLRLIHQCIGNAMSTLRRIAAQIEAQA